MIKKTVKKLVSCSPIFKSAAYIADDLMWGLGMAAGQITSDCGATHLAFSELESVNYIEEVFKDYKYYGSFDRFSGLVAEIGPGDNAGVGLLMRQDGCSQVDLIDRYSSRRNPQQQSQIYQTLAQRYPIDIFRTIEAWDDHAFEGINWKIGQSAEAYFEKCAQSDGEIYDFIVSRAVLEHLYNPLDALRYMVACLKPGGKMLHKIDFRDHGMFVPIYHELKFLEMPSKIYTLMTKNSARPNRILIHCYRMVLDELKNAGLIDYSILITQLVDVGEIKPHKAFEEIDLTLRNQSLKFVENHRPQFSNEFNQVDTKDIATAGVFLIVNKK